MLEMFSSRQLSPQARVMQAQPDVVILHRDRFLHGFHSRHLFSLRYLDIYFELRHDHNASSNSDIFVLVHHDSITHRDRIFSCQQIDPIILA